MTREEFERYNPEDFDLMKEIILKRAELNSQMEEIDKKIQENEDIQFSLDTLIVENLDSFNAEKDPEKQNEILDKLKKLRETEIKIKDERKALDILKNEKQNELDELNGEKKVSSGFIDFVKDKKNSFSNRLKVRREGLKSTKGNVRNFKDKAINRVKTTAKLAGIYTVAAAKATGKALSRGAKEVGETATVAKDYVVDKAEDAKEWVKEKAPEVKDKAILRINKTTSAIAKTTKKTLNGIIGAFNKVSTFVEEKRVIVVAKTERFKRIHDIKVAAKKELREKNAQIEAENKEELLRLREKLNAAKLSAEQEYQEQVNNAKTL